MRALPAVVLCCASGFALVCAGWPRRSPLASDLLLKLSLTPCCGFGLFSLIFFLCLPLSFSSLMVADTAVLGLLATTLLWIRSPRTSGVTAQMRRDRTAGWLLASLPASFAVSLILFLYSAVARMQANPHGIG